MSLLYVVLALMGVPTTAVGSNEQNIAADWALPGAVNPIMTCGNPPIDRRQPIR
jgi:hypothetical protein